MYHRRKKRLEAGDPWGCHCPDVREVYRLRRVPGGSPTVAYKQRRWFSWPCSSIPEQKAAAGRPASCPPLLPQPTWPRSPESTSWPRRSSPRTRGRCPWWRVRSYRRRSRSGRGLWIHHRPLNIGVGLRVALDPGVASLACAGRCSCGIFTAAMGCPLRRRWIKGRGTPSTLKPKRYFVGILRDIWPHEQLKIRRFCGSTLDVRSAHRTNNNRALWGAGRYWPNI